MKRTTSLKAVLLALAGMAILATQPLKATTLSYTSDDLLLGFRLSGGTQDYVINIGQASLYSGSSFTLSIGSIATDLTTLDANWKTDGLLTWGIAGAVPVGSTVGSDAQRTTYVSSPDPLTGIAATGQPRYTLSQQGTNANDINAMGVTLYNGLTGNAANSKGLFQTAATAGSWASWVGAGDYGNVEANFGAGTASAALDLSRQATGTGNGTYAGSFTINDSGVVSFQTTVVPEPSTFMVLGIGAFILLTFRRRSVINV